MIVNLRNTIFVSFALFVFVSCQDLKKTERPDNLIPEDKMIDVLTELALVNAARNYNKQKLEQTGIEPDVYVYEKYGIDSLQFERSNDYYAEQYTQYERIYDSVKSRIQVMKSRLDSLREIEVKIEDSIRQAKKDSLKMPDSLKVKPGEVDSLKVDSIKLKKLEEQRKRKAALLINSPVPAKDSL